MEASRASWKDFFLSLTRWRLSVVWPSSSIIPHFVLSRRINKAFREFLFRFETLSVYWKSWEKWFGKQSMELKKVHNLWLWDQIWWREVVSSHKFLLMPTSVYDVKRQVTFYLRTCIVGNRPALCDPLAVLESCGGFCPEDTHKIWKTALQIITFNEETVFISSIVLKTVNSSIRGLYDLSFMKLKRTTHSDRTAAYSMTSFVVIYIWMSLIK